MVPWFCVKNRVLLEIHIEIFTDEMIMMIGILEEIGGGMDEAELAVS